MLLTLLVIVVVSGALVAGAALGIYGGLSDEAEGFLVALAGGALLISAVLELVEPATKKAPVWAVLLVVLVGAAAFSGLDYLVDERWGSGNGGGLLAAITLDGIPENLALGVALISTGPLQVAALSGSILLSNLPEAAGGAKAMSGGDRSDRAVFGLWGATAALLALAALAGNLLLSGASKELLALLQAFAGGAVVASLATEVFPKAFNKDSYPPRPVRRLRRDAAAPRPEQHQQPAAVWAAPPSAEPDRPRCATPTTSPAAPTAARHPCATSSTPSTPPHELRA